RREGAVGNFVGGREAVSGGLDARAAGPEGGAQAFAAVAVGIDKQDAVAPVGRLSAEPDARHVVCPLRSFAKATAVPRRWRATGGRRRSVIPISYQSPAETDPSAPCTSHASCRVTVTRKRVIFPFPRALA